MAQLAVIGSGSMGTSIAYLLGSKGHQVALWSHNPRHSEHINATHHNPVYLTDALLENVTGTGSLEEACKGAEAIFMVTPSVNVRTTAEKMAPYVAEQVPVAILSKGIEENTGKTMADVLVDVFGNAERIAAVSGPNHAEEIVQGKVTCTTAASASIATAEVFQELMSTPWFRVYTSTDVIGVEMCAAAKNIIAIANGCLVASGMGDNASAALITRGLAEVGRLVLALGGDERTCLGLSGVGDLVVTCTSVHSRNRKLGTMLAQGKTLEDFEAETKMVAEGAVACRTVTALAEKHGVEMPIAQATRAVLAGETSIEDAVKNMFARPWRPELDMKG